MFQLSPSVKDRENGGKYIVGNYYTVGQWNSGEFKCLFHHKRIPRCDDCKTVCEYHQMQRDNCEVCAMEKKPCPLHKTLLNQPTQLSPKLVSQLMAPSPFWRANVTGTEFKIRSKKVAGIARINDTITVGGYAERTIIKIEKDCIFLNKGIGVQEGATLVLKTDKDFCRKCLRARKKKVIDWKRSKSILDYTQFPKCKKCSRRFSLCDKHKLRR